MGVIACRELHATCLRHDAEGAFGSATPMPGVRRSPDDALLMTPDQYLAQAASLRAWGNEYLAQQYDNLFQMRTSERPIDQANAKRI